MNAILAPVGHFIQPFFLLCVRIFWGWQFFMTGIGKLSDIGSVASFFASLGIPYPLLNAYSAATVETVGGVCLIVGFCSRLVSIPLITLMVVALITAHKEAAMTILQDPLNFVGQLPFTFLFASIIVFTFGPGKFSIDGK